MSRKADEGIQGCMNGTGFWGTEDFRPLEELSLTTILLGYEGKKEGPPSQYLASPSILIMTGYTS